MLSGWRLIIRGSRSHYEILSFSFSSLTSLGFFQYPEITLNDVRLFGEFEELFVVFLASYISPCIFQFTLDDLVSWKQCWALWKNRNIWHGQSKWMCIHVSHSCFRVVYEFHWIFYLPTPPRTSLSTYKTYVIRPALHSVVPERLLFNSERTILSPNRLYYAYNRGWPTHPYRLVGRIH